MRACLCHWRLNVPRFRRSSGFDLSDWTNKKYTLGLDFPNLPYWIEGNLRITQSQAILLHVAKKARLMGGTDEARAQALMLLGVSADLRDAFVTLSYGGSFDTARGAFVSGPLASTIKSLEAFAAKSGGPYLLGAELTFVDFLWADLLEQLVTLEPACLAGAPMLKKLIDTVYALPKISAYRASPAYIDRPYNNKQAHFK
jgi:glutathione S-transferase